MKVREYIVGAAVFVGLLLTCTPTVHAQEKTGASTVILKFENRNVSQSVMDTFYRSLDKVVDQSEEMHTVSGGAVTIQEMIVTAGCQEANAECLAGLSDFVDGDRMVFGSVKRSGDAYLFTIKLFDFQDEEFVRTVSEQTVEGDEATVKRAIPGVVQNFMHGDVGTLRVSVTGGPGSAEVSFDGESMGSAPTTLENLPLGQHALTVSTPGGKEKTKLVLLQKGETKTVEFNLESDAVATEEGGGGGGAVPILGYSSAGLGVAGMVVGFVGLAQNVQASKSANELQCPDRDALCSDEYEGEALAREAEQRDKRVTNTAVLSTVGYSVGFVGLGAGGYLLYRHYFASADDDSTAVVKSFGVRPTPHGAQFQLSLEF